MKTLVVARFEEDVTWLEKVPADVVKVGIQKEVDLPNIGRESFS